jgi:hypothetical protein
MSVGKNHPDWLVEKDGKIYFTPPNSPSGQTGLPSPQPSAAVPAGASNLSEEQMKIFRERYGINPANQAAPQ